MCSFFGGKKMDIKKKNKFLIVLSVILLLISSIIPNFCNAINLSEDIFKPYESPNLYQALDYLTETDKELQKKGFDDNL